MVCKESETVKNVLNEMMRGILIDLINQSIKVCVQISKF